MSNDKYLFKDTKEKLKILKSLRKISPEEKKKVLYNAGIINKKGQLTPQYQ